MIMLAGRSRCNYLSAARRAVGWWTKTGEEREWAGEGRRRTGNGTGFPETGARIEKVTPADPTVLMDGEDVRRAIDRMAHEVLEKLGGTRRLVLIGIQRRGVDLADMIGASIAGVEGEGVPTGTLDITFYRDDLMALGPRPLVGETRLPPGGVDDRAVVLVDDVLYTGRTARAALNELMDWGRPARILLCVLVDRGDRELPIQPDIVGREFQVLANQRVDVLVPRLDGRLAVVLGAVERG